MFLGHRLGLRFHSKSCRATAETSRCESLKVTSPDSSTSLGMTRFDDNPMPSENILVVKRSLFDELGAFQGLIFDPQRYLGALLSRGNNFFLPRAAAENDPTHKQIIPYVIVAHRNRVLYYVRSKKAGEQRWVAKGSMGIGGHMNDTDESLFAWDEEAYQAGVEREVNEEIRIETTFDDRIVALLNDDSTEVGHVHLGVVHVFNLDEPKVEKREAMITNLEFLSREELLKRRDTLETWSQLCVDQLEKLIAAAVRR